MTSRIPFAGRTKPLVAVFAALMVMLSMAFDAKAHDGLHMTHILTDVVEIDVAAQRVTLSLAISNHSEEDFVLQKIQATGARVDAIVPLKIQPGAQQGVEVTLIFETPVPGIFTALLDFGANGQGPVLVII